MLHSSIPGVIGPELSVDTNPGSLPTALTTMSPIPGDFPPISSGPGPSYPLPPSLPLPVSSVSGGRTVPSEAVTAPPAASLQQQLPGPVMSIWSTVASPLPPPPPSTPQVTSAATYSLAASSFGASPFTVSVATSVAALPGR